MSTGVGMPARPRRRPAVDARGLEHHRHRGRRTTRSSSSPQTTAHRAPCCSSSSCTVSAGVKRAQSPERVRASSHATVRTRSRRATRRPLPAPASARPPSATPPGIGLEHARTHDPSHRHPASPAPQAEPERGSALLGALLFSIVIAGMAVVLVSIIVTAAYPAALAQARGRTVYNAEAGLQSALGVLRAAKVSPAQRSTRRPVPTSVTGRSCPARSRARRTA